MGHRFKFTLVFLILQSPLIFLQAQVAVNTDGSNPEASAMLDISSTDRGLLIPRMSSLDRTGILNPAEGLMVYDSTTHSFWFYTESAWNDLSSLMRDADGDTKIQVEESADEDLIRFDMNGTEYLRLEKGRIEPVNTGGSVFLGEGAGENDQLSDNQNVFVGFQSGHLNTTGAFNSFVGYQSGYSNTTGITNSFQGYKSGYSNTTGASNAFLGYLSGFSNSTGLGNAFFGTTSGYANSTGGSNTFIGNVAGNANTTGQSNTFLGNGSGNSNTTGSYNTFLGALSGLFNEEGDRNVFIGHQAGYNETGSNKLYIENSNSDSPLIYGEFDNDLVTINGKLNISDTLNVTGTLLVNGANTASPGFTSENNLTSTVNNDDDFIVGGDNLAWSSGTEMKLFFDKDKGAFRTGAISTNRWDESNIGTVSTAWGNNCQASGDYSTAWGLSTASGNYGTSWGYDTRATGSSSTAWGDDSRASEYAATAWGYNNIAGAYNSTAWGSNTETIGNHSTVLGVHNKAQSYAETVMGTYASEYSANSTSSIDPEDRLLVIGNGTGDGSRSDAMIVYKSGDTEINGQLTVSGALMVDGRDLSETAFTSADGLTSIENNSDDFLIGANSLSYAGSGNEEKMFYDAGLGAFRTGRIQSTNWDNTNLGTYSFATGNNTIASGSTSAAFGYQTLASGVHAIAGGNQSEATANLAFAYGREMYARSFGEIALGLYGTDYSPNETTDFDEEDRLFSLGNGSADNSRSDALVVYKSGDTEINGALKLNNAFTFPTADGSASQVLTTDGSGNLSWSDAGSSSSVLEDSDANTSVDVSSNDRVSFRMNGTEYFRMQAARMEVYNTGNSVFIGDNAGQNDDLTSNQNIAIGDGSLKNNVSGAGNTAIGVLALENTTAIGNTAAGIYAGEQITSGSGNVLYGYNSGAAITTGSFNVMIGSDAGGSSNVSNRLFIDNSNTDSPLIWGNFSGNRLVINGNGTHNSNNRTLFVQGSIGATSAFNNDSDRRLKTNVQTIPNALSKVLEMRGVTYEWKDGREKGDRMGFIAQEVEPILPEVVDNENDHYTMQYAPITAVLVEAVKEQQSEIEELKTQVAKLEELEHLSRNLAEQNAEMKVMLEQIQAQFNN